ncbi:substrate-binding periplasmic protein [Dongia sp.]|jgi:polar amino acid transport system substrate-binding protein|uniref:substrate-binding periplasmic protein n=1 Tax=Dongia sp. TaxID=1977262 RepID=UPI0035B018EC
MLQRAPILLVLFGAAVGLFSMPPARAKEPLHLVFAADLIPLSFEDGGVARGILIDVAREVFEHRLGLTVDAALYPWERAQQMVKRGEADGFITVATKARAEYANCGRIPVLRAQLHPLIRSDHARRQEIAAATNLAALKPFSIVSYFGNGWAKQNLADFDVIYATDFQASLRGLAQGRGDLALVTMTAGAYYLREFGLEKKLVMLPLTVDRFEYVLCLGKQSPQAALLPEFDRVLDVMRSEGAYAPILREYGLEPKDYY